jgi:hypothetical protein
MEHIDDPTDPHSMDTSPGADGAGLSGGMATGPDAGAGPGGPDGGWAAGGEEAEDAEAGPVDEVDVADDVEVSPGSFLTDPSEMGGDDQTPGAVMPDDRVPEGGDVDPGERGRGMGDLTSGVSGDDEPHPESVDRAAATGPDLQPGAADET